MKLSIRSVKDHGELKDERIVLRVLEDTDVGGYILADTTYFDDGRVSNELRHVFWIPDKEVEKGDLIVIYTKSGKDFSRRNDSGNQTHFFYWGLDRTIWNQAGDGAALFDIREWTAKSV